MEQNWEEALKAKENAEKRFALRDFTGARNYALKAQSLCPGLDGISQTVATLDVYVASEAKINGETDFYSVLGLKPNADRSMVKRHYKKLAFLLHPDKNRSVGADGAFRIASEAWAILSDNSKRASYDLKRNGQMSSAVVSGAAYCDKSSMPPTFWTVCTSCQVQYEYLRKYVNKRLSCKNCRATFMAVELGTAPINGSYPVGSWSYVPDTNGHGSHHHGYNNNVSYYPTNTVYVAGNSVPGYHSGHGSDYASNMSFQWGTTCPGTTTGYVDPNGFSSASADATYHANGYVNKPGKKIQGAAGVSNDGVASVNANGSCASHESVAGIMKTTRPYKKRKVDFVTVPANGNSVGGKVVSEAAKANGNGSSSNNAKVAGPNEPSRRCSFLPAIDVRILLMEKARKEIRKKLEEIRLASAAESEKKKEVGKGAGGRPAGIRRKSNLGISHPEPKRSGPLTLTVPDSDFHDFDKDRLEECFKPKQIWALYDEEDGMPRLYCLIRQIISLSPFKIHISYLSSKSDAEFGPVNWISSGFTKSCGHFRASNSDVVEQVNMFSHLLSKEKVGRGGCARIYPKRGDIWAVYRNWSSDWSRSTPYEVRHQYEMVEVVDDYKEEELGVWVNPLIKLEGFKTVYQRNADKGSRRWIPRGEMLRFSHQVPSWMLKEVNDLPEGCWDLDPAATPEELLRDAKEDVKVEEKRVSEVNDS